MIKSKINTQQRNNVSPQSDNRKKGYKGEQDAASYLEGKGYRIIKKNFHFGRYGELDLVAQDGECLVFVEVKLRRSRTFGHPLESITPKKVAALRRAAEGYLYVNKLQDVPCRFDVIAIDQSQNKTEITHIENAF
jgi:putative endonuclease